MKGNPKKLKLTKMEQEWISDKIRYLKKKEGKTTKEAAGQAYSMVRQARKKGTKPHA